MGSRYDAQGSDDGRGGDSHGTLWTQMIDVLLDVEHPDREEIWRGFLGRYRRLITQCMRARLREERQQRKVEDFVDEFVSYLGTGNVLKTVDRSRGRFRCYLQGAIRLFVKDRLRGDRRLRGSVEGLDSIPARDDGITEFEREHDHAYVVELLRQALVRLHERSPTRAMAVVMRYGISCEFADVDQPMRSDAIAAALDLASGSTARGHVAQGVEQLRSILRYAIGETIHGSSQAEYDAAYLDERAVVEARLEEVYPDLFGRASR